MTSTTSSSTSIPPNGKLLSWNSPLDAAEHFETVMLSLQTSMLKDDLYYTLSEVSVTNRLTDFPHRPDGVNITEAAYLAAKKNWHTSLLKTNSDTNKAQGSFLALFHPECNAHRSLLLWFEEDVTSARRPRERKRTDYNLRNMRDKFYAEYRPDKEVNLTAIKKKWEALSDQNMSFSEFMGEWIKGVADMERIGQKPTEARQYEVLRLNVRNPNLRNIKEGLSYPEDKRMKIDDFFQVCNTYLQLNPDEDSIDHKRKAEDEVDPVVAKAAKVGDESAKPKQGGRCYRCGNPGHWKLDWETGKICRVQHCATCGNHIGNKSHNAATCSDKGKQLFKTVKKEKKPADTKKKDWKRGKAGKKSNSSGGGGAQPAQVQHEGNDNAFTPEVIAALADLGLEAD